MVNLSVTNSPDGSIFPWISDPTTPPCGNLSPSQETLIYNSADYWLNQQFGIHLTNYDAVLFVLPPNTAPNCGGQPGDGTPQQGYPISAFVFTTSADIFNQQGIKDFWYYEVTHELGHSLGYLGSSGTLTSHANTFISNPAGQMPTNNQLNTFCPVAGPFTPPCIVPYGDPFDPMGSAPVSQYGGGPALGVEYSAYHRGQMGYLQSSNKADITTSETFNLYPIEQGSGLISARIPIYNIYSTPMYYYLEYRQPNDDFDGSPAFSNSKVFTGVSVRLAPDYTNNSITSMLVDTNPVTGNDFTDAPLGIGETYTLPYDIGNTSVQLKTVALNSSYATVQVTYPGAQSNWYINSGGSAYTDGQGNHWAADEDYYGGGTYSTSNTIQGTSDQALYKSERFGSPFSYTLGVPGGTTYDVILKFSENYWSAAGKRVFDVYINGTKYLSNFDIYATAGGRYIAVDKSFDNISPDAQNFITIQLGPASVDNAKVDAVEIIPHGSGPNPCQYASAGNGTYCGDSPWLNYGGSWQTMYTCNNGQTTNTQNCAPGLCQLNAFGVADQCITNPCSGANCGTGGYCAGQCGTTSQGSYSGPARPSNEMLLQCSNRSTTQTQVCTQGCQVNNGTSDTCKNGQVQTCQQLGGACIQSLNICRANCNQNPSNACQNLGCANNYYCCFP